MRGRTTAVLWVTALALAAGACGSGEGAGADPPPQGGDVTLEDVAARVDGRSAELILSTGRRSINDLVAYRAFDCAKEVFGLTIDSVPVPSAVRTSVQAVLANQVQMGEVSVGQIGAAVAEGAELAVIAPHDVANDYVLVTTEEVAGPEDMAGRIHGAAAPTGVDPFNFNTIYEKAGVKDDVQVVLVGGSSDRVAALVSGKIDAAMLHPYDAELVIQRGGFHQIAVAADEVPPIINDVFFVQQGWLEENRDVALALSACVFAEADWMYANTEDALSYALETVPDRDPEITDKTMRALFEIKFWGNEPLEPSVVGTTLSNDGLDEIEPDAILAGELMDQARTLADEIKRER